MLQEWFKQVVDKEDLTRHDKWLCMMMPRLKLLRELLRDDGVIFISIDDNEAHRLRMLMDEIFGEENFVACITVQLNPRGRTLDRFLAKTHEYLLVYANQAENDLSINLLEKAGAKLDEYNKSDKKGKYRELELRNRNPVFNRQNRPNLFYSIFANPQNGSVALESNNNFSIEILPRNSKGEDGCWTWGKPKAENNKTLLTARQVNTGEWRVFRKDYLYDDEGEIALTKEKALWIDRNINNENGKEIVRQLLGNSPFDFPKSVDLIKKCIELGTHENDIILDSFAGSGTTAHAVLALNAEDGGNRRFILIEQEGYADTITAERVRRVIQGVPTAKDKVLQAGLGGSFTYCTLGPSFDEDELLRGGLPAYQEMARFVFFTATGEQLDEAQLDQENCYLGESSRYSVYLIYKPDVEYLKHTPLDLKFAMNLPVSEGKLRLVIASHKYLDEHRMAEYDIEFCQLPFGIYRYRAD